MNRRSFLKSASLSALSVFSIGCAATAVRNKKEKPLFTFIQLTDTHVNVPFGDNTVYSGANKRMQWFLESLENGVVAKPDFILHTGDMIHGAKLESLGPDAEAFDENVLKKLAVPFYPCVGNHENLQGAGFPDHEEAYRKTFGSDKLNYTFEHGGILFVIFDDSYDPSQEPEHQHLRQQRLQWLENVFVQNPNKPKILCCHIPLVSMREEEVLKKSFGFSSWKSFDDQLLTLLSANKDSIVAVLSGHLHLTGCVKVDGIYHIVASGLASYPHDYAVFKVYSDRIDVSMHSVPKALQEPYLSNIHNSRRHGIDYTDKNHPTHEAYVGGNPDERGFSMPLPPRV